MTDTMGDITVEDIPLDDYEEELPLQFNSSTMEDRRENHKEIHSVSKSQSMDDRRDEDTALDLQTEESPQPSARKWPKQRRCLDLNVRWLFAFGFWPTDGTERRGMLFYWTYFYPRVHLIRMVYSIIFQAINISLVQGNASLMAEYISMLGSYTMVLCKCLTLFFNQATMQDMASTLERLCSQSPTTNKHFKLAMEETNRSVHYVTKLFFVNTAIVSMLLALGLIIQGFVTGTIPFRRWFPYDAYSSPAYELTLICTFVAVPFDVSGVVLCDMMFVAMSMHILAQFLALSQKLRYMRANVTTTRENGGDIKSRTENIALWNTREDSAKNVMCREAQSECFSRSTESHVEVFDTEGVETDEGDMNEGRSSNGGARRRRLEDELQLAMIMSETKTRKKMERFLKCCIQDHQALIRLCSQLGSVFKLMLSFQVACNISCGLLVFYVTTLAPSVDLKFLSIASIMLFGYIEYLLFCWYGNRITEESVNVREAMYDCDWFEASDGFKRSMRIMMLRTYKPIIIRAGGLPLSMPTFKKIYKAAYYLNMLLSKLFHGEMMIKKKL